MVAESARTGDYSFNADMFHLAFNYLYGYWWGSKIRGSARASPRPPNAAADYRRAQDALVIGRTTPRAARWLRA
jgi:hypothetical protein